MSAGSPISAARRVRFIGEPGKRIAEDYLRILRFFRFHAAYGDGGHPDAEGLAACIAGRAGLEQLSRERVRMELMKLLLAPHAMPALIAMTDAGLLAARAGRRRLSRRLREHGQGRGGAGLPADPVRRLGALGVAVAEDAERLWQKLRLANAEHERLSSMGEGWRRIAPATTKRRRARCSIGSSASASPTASCWPGRARKAAAHDEAWRALASLPQRWTPPVFPLKAADFIARGVEKGPALGAALRAAEEAWIAAGFPGDAAALETIAVGAARK